MIRISNRFLGLAALLSCFYLMPHVAWAVNNCPGATVTATALSFGTYDPMTGAAVTSTATLTVKCNTSNVEPITNVQLNAGTTTGATLSQRLMVNTAVSDTLKYNLYVSPSYVATNIWGDGTAGTLDPGGSTSGVSGNNTLVMTVYGEIPANLDPSGACPSTPCSYSDSVTITVNF